MGDVAAEFRDLFDEVGAGVAVGLVGHNKQGLAGGLEMAVHERHIELKLEVGKRAETADNGVGFLFAGKFDEEAVEGSDGDVGHSGRGCAEEVKALLNGEEGAFAGIVCHGQGDAVKEAGGTAQDVDMAVGDGVEGTGIDAVLHGGESFVGGPKGGEGKSRVFGGCVGQAG